MRVKKVDIFFYGLLLAILFGPPCMGQKRLTIGDKCPEARLSMFNHKESESYLSSFSGNWIVLDFWNTYCKGCIRKLPEYDALEKRFGDTLRILPVTAQDRAVVSKFWQSNKFTRGVNLPTVVNDTVLKQYFPHRTVPHLVWINPEMTVVAITDAEFLSAETIADAMAGKTLSFPVKNDLDPEYNGTVIPVFQNHGGKDDLKGYSVVSPYKYGAPQSFGLKFDTVGTNVHVSAVNLSVVELYQSTLANKDWRQYRSRFVLEGIDSSQVYHQMSREEYDYDWNRKYRFCYEGLFPIQTEPDEILQYVRDDLNLWLPYAGRLERRLVSCLVLMRDSTSQHLSTVKNPSSYRLALLMRRLNRIQLGLPVINGTGFDIESSFFSDRVKLPSTENNDLASINHALKKVGLHLEICRQELEIFIVQGRTANCP